MSSEESPAKSSREIKNLSTSTPDLELDRVTKEFGGFKAVDDVSLSIDYGGITALIGPNGAGKTTLFNLISGRLTPTSGDIFYDGREITDLPPHERVHLGLCQSFQITNAFPGLTVRENVRTPIIARSDARNSIFRSVSENDDIRDKTDEILQIVDLVELEDRYVEDLSYGQQRRVELGISLATDPDLLLLDEPTAGMNPSRVSTVTDLISDIQEEYGMKIVIIEHDLDVAFSLASDALFLHEGKLLHKGTPEEIQANEDVQTAYLGIEE